ncbi:MAG: thioesterase, partial [Bacteroidota bacterium]|nr:thioesterase [Bacteroidota bacterium]
MHVYKSKPAISMLITNMQVSYYKKATGKTFFVCAEGKEIRDAIENSIFSKETKSVTAKSIGTNKDGDVVAEFLFTWSFKVKSF